MRAHVHTALPSLYEACGLGDFLAPPPVCEGGAWRKRTGHEPLGDILEALAEYAPSERAGEPHDGIR